MACIQVKQDQVEGDREDFDREHEEYLEKTTGHGINPLPVNPRDSITTGRMYQWELAQQNIARALADDRFYKGC